MSLRISGRSGETRYLLVDESVPAGEPPPADTYARILDTEGGVLHEPQPFHTITAHVPTFEAYEADEGELAALLDGVEVRGPPKTEIGDAADGFR